METVARRPLPQGLQSRFEVLSMTGPVGAKNWVIRDTNSRQEYEVGPSTIDGWAIPVKLVPGPSIIVKFDASLAIAMHLETGQFYRSAFPSPARIRSRAQTVAAIKSQRAEHVNALIKAISTHGRRFFFNAQKNQIARIDVDAGGRIWYIDDWKIGRILTNPTGLERHGWGEEFPKGGTLKRLIEQMRDYIRTGETIDLYWITEPRDEDDNIWGYSHEAATALRSEVASMPIITNTCLHDLAQFV